MRRLAYWLLSASSLFSFAALLWALSQNPFAAPLVARSDAAARAALTRAMAWNATELWAVETLEAAIIAENADEVELVLRIVADRGLTLPPELVAQAELTLAEAESLPVAAMDCARCAYDIGACARLAQIAACALPVELSPLGDLNALRRAGVDYAVGDDVDRLEVGLALTGLGATGLAVYSGGTSLTVKAGASLVRAGRRMGALSAPLMRRLYELSDLPVNWSKVPDLARNRVGLEAVTDVDKLAELGRMAHSMGEVRAATSTADALALARHVDNASDAADLARVAGIEGDGTRATMRVLGKGRAFRALYRLSNLALMVVGLIAALLLQIPALLAETMRHLLRPRKGSVA